MAASSDREHLQELFVAIKAVIRKIPRGQVATYGQVAELAGIPGGARIAAAALKTSVPGDRLPWQRVIGKAGRTRGRIAIHDPIGAAIQRNLLEEEGVDVGETGLVALDVYGLGQKGRTAAAAVRKTTAAAVVRNNRNKRSVKAGSSRGASPRRPPRSASKRRASSSRR